MSRGSASAGEENGGRKWDESPTLDAANMILKKSPQKKLSFWGLNVLTAQAVIGEDAKQLGRVRRNKQ